MTLFQTFSANNNGDRSGEVIKFQKKSSAITTFLHPSQLQDLLYLSAFIVKGPWKTTRCATLANQKSLIQKAHKWCQMTFDWLRAAVYNRRVAKEAILFYLFGVFILVIAKMVFKHWSNISTW